MPAPGAVTELGDAGPAGVAVIDDDRRRVGVREVGRRDTADIPTVADREQREDADARVLDRVQRAGHLFR